MTSVAVSSLQRASETLHLPQAPHVYICYDGDAIWGYCMYVIFAAAGISYMLTAVCLGCIGSSKISVLALQQQQQQQRKADLFHRNQKLNIVMYIMLIPPRVCHDRNIIIIKNITFNFLPYCKNLNK